MTGGFGSENHLKRHDMGDAKVHKGDIYEGLMAAVNAITALNPVADQKYVADQILAALKGLDWQESVLSREAAQPATPSTGDRYIATATAGDWTKDNIYEWDGTAWIETVPNKGTTTVVEAEALAYTFIVTPSNAWVTLGSVIDHAALNNREWSTAGHTMDTDLPMATFKVTGMGDPTLAQDAATKNYVDNIVSEPKQAIGLYVSETRGNDTTGDGSLFNPFETVQKAVDYAYANYFGEPADIFVRTEPLSFQMVTIPPGMEVNIICTHKSYYNVQTIQVTVSQFCYVSIDGGFKVWLVEDDPGDIKVVTLKDCVLNPFEPSVTPSIHMEVFGANIDTVNLSDVVDNVASIYGYYVRGAGALTVFGTFIPPIVDTSVATKKYVDDNEFDGDHASLSNVTTDQHHAKSHAHDGVDGSGTVAHSDLTGIGSDDHHAKVHASTHYDALSGGDGTDPLLIEKLSVTDGGDGDLVPVTQGDGSLSLDRKILVRDINDTSIMTTHYKVVEHIFSYTNGGITLNLQALKNASVKPKVVFGIELNGLAYDSRVQVTPVVTSLTHNGTHWVLVVRCNKTYYQAVPPGIVFTECATNDVDITIMAGGE